MGRSSARAALNLRSNRRLVFTGDRRLSSVDAIIDYADPVFFRFAGSVGAF